MSRSIFICLDDVSFYGGNSSFPVFDSGRSNPITTKEAVIILKSEIKSSSICNKTPFYIKNNVSFIVNAEKLSHWKDIRIGMMDNIVFSITFKGYLRYITITSQNVSSEAQVKNFFIS